MSKAVGWAVGGAIVSITIGVLVGLVLHAGQLERADRLPPPDAAAETSVTGDAPTSLPRPPTTSWTPASTPTPSMTPPDALSPGSSPGPPVTDSADVMPPPETATGTTATTASTGTTPSPGTDAAGAPCPELASRSSDVAGTTLYCQVDQVDRALRWRAVVDKGGCLSQSMTGIAADGRTYRCRLDDSGLNHWASTG